MTEVSGVEVAPRRECGGRDEGKAVPRGTLESSGWILPMDTSEAGKRSWTMAAAGE